MLEYFEQTEIANWVSSSQWSYLTTLITHGIGMAVVVGIAVIISFKLLGFPRGIAIGQYRSLMPVLIFGVLLNLVSGVVLFMADAVHLFYSRPFQVKILMIIIGSILLWWIDSRILKVSQNNMSDASQDIAISKPVKWIALASIFTWWFSVVLSGRLIAYIDLGM